VAPDFGRAARRALALLTALLLLPWLFVASSWSFPTWPRPSESPAPASAAVPVPAGYPALVVYVPIPLPDAERWIQQHYPGSLIGLRELETIDAAARRWDVSLALLLGMLGAEQGFLRYVPGNEEHALEFYANPFDYGVWPGSPYPLAIGLAASASGAASIVARIAEMFPRGAWDTATYRAFLSALSGWYAYGDTLRPDPTWMRNVALIAAGIWGAARSDLIGWAVLLARHLSAHALAALLATLGPAARHAASLARAIPVKLVAALSGAVLAAAALAAQLASAAGSLGEALLPLLALAA